MKKILNSIQMTNKIKKLVKSKSLNLSIRVFQINSLMIIKIKMIIIRNLIKKQRNLLPLTRVNLIQAIRKIIIIGDGANKTSERSQKKKKLLKRRSNGQLLMLNLMFKPNKKKKKVLKALITNLKKIKKR